MSAARRADDDRGPEPTIGADAPQGRRTLVASLRHDLLTPINGLIGYSELLLEDTSPEGDEDRVDLGQINALGRLLLGRVNEVFGPAKLAGGRGRDSLGPLQRDLRASIDAAAGHAERLIGRARVRDDRAALPDLEKIADAAQQFRGLIEEIVRLPQLATGELSRAVEAKRAPGLVAGVARALLALERDSGTAPATGGTILVVDDNGTNRDLLAQRLGRQGHLVVTAEDGRRALAILAERPFDLILLDILMPELDGYQVLGRVKADERLRDIPVIMISALDELDSVVRCIELGAEDYLPKPFNPVLLRARLGASLEKKRLRDRERALLAQLRQEADADPVTGLLNHRALHRRLDEALAQVRRREEALTVLMMDLDGFKRINDTYGHPAGDQLLQAVAAALRAAVRATDTVGRYGGDEFLAILPGASVAEASAAAARLRGALDAVTIPALGAGPHRLGISAGIAAYPDDGRTAGALVAAADASLYVSKRRGGGLATHGQRAGT